MTLESDDNGWELIIAESWLNERVLSSDTGERVRKSAIH